MAGTASGPRCSVCRFSFWLVITKKGGFSMFHFPPESLPELRMILRAACWPSLPPKRRKSRQGAAPAPCYVLIDDTAYFRYREIENFW